MNGSGENRLPGRADVFSLRIRVRITPPCNETRRSRPIFDANRQHGGMSTSVPPAPLLTIPQVADRLGISIRTVRRRIERGDIPAVRLGSGQAPIRIDSHELSEWIYGFPPRATPLGPFPEAVQDGSGPREAGPSALPKDEG